MNSGLDVSQEAVTRESLCQIERLLSDLAELAKRGDWERVPDIENELSKKLARLRTTDWSAVSSPSLIKQLRSIQQQLDANTESCSVRLEQIRPLIVAFSKKQAISPDGNNSA
jgi:hypothetical protein